MSDSLRPYGLYSLRNSPGQNTAKKKKRRLVELRANVMGNMSYSLLLKHLFIVVLFNLFYPSPHKNAENPMGIHKIPKVANWKCFKTNKGMGIKWVYEWAGTTLRIFFNRWKSRPPGRLAAKFTSFLRSSWFTFYLSSLHVERNSPGPKTGEHESRLQFKC